MQYLRIRRAYYIAARRATMIEQHTVKVIKDGECSSQNTVKIAEEAFSKEWQKVLLAESLHNPNNNAMNVIELGEMADKIAFGNQKLTSSDSNVAYSETRNVVL